MKWNCNLWNKIKINKYNIIYKIKQTNEQNIENVLHFILKYK